MDSSNPAYASFLIRLWLQPSDGGVAKDSLEGELLLQVEHIPNGEKHYFSSLGALCTHLEKQKTELEKARRA